MHELVSVFVFPSLCRPEVATLSDETCYACGPQ